MSVWLGQGRMRGTRRGWVVKRGGNAAKYWGRGGVVVVVVEDEVPEGGDWRKSLPGTGNVLGVFVCCILMILERTYDLVVLEPD